LLFHGHMFRFCTRHGNIYLIMKISVKVKTNSKTARVQEKEGVLHVWLDVPPVEGRANKRLIELLSEHYGRPRSLIYIKSGLKSRNKIVVIEGV